jgi:hypothetical protein
MCSVALAIEKLRASRNNIKHLVLHKIQNQRHFVTGTCTYPYSSFIIREIPSKLAYAFLKSANATGAFQIFHINLKCLDFHLLYVE